VRNLRAAGRATLTRGRRSEEVGVVEVGPEEAAPVLRRYPSDTPITRAYFDATPDSPLPAFAAEAPGTPSSEWSRAGTESAHRRRGRRRLRYRISE
jgi:hypothetical protein